MTTCSYYCWLSVDDEAEEEVSIVIGDVNVEVAGGGVVSALICAVYSSYNRVIPRA